LLVSQEIFGKPPILQPDLIKPEKKPKSLRMSRIFERPRELDEDVKRRIERCESAFKKFNPENAKKRESEKLASHLANQFGPSEKWLDEVFLKYSLSYRAYAAYEVIFRQLMQYRTDKTGFSYVFEENALDYLGVKGLHPAERLSRIESYITKTRVQKRGPFYYYGMGQLFFEKWGVIERAGTIFKQQLGEIESLTQMAADFSDKDGEKHQFIDLLAELNLLKEKLHAAVKKEIQIGSRPLRGFVKINEDGSFTVSQWQFDYFRIYCSLYFSLLEPHFLEIRDPNSEEFGLHTFIADKINFEIGHQLNFKFTSEMSSNRKRDSKSINFLETLARDLNLVDDDFYEFIQSANWNKRLMLPYQYEQEYLGNIDSKKSA
jgi:hypothetical protein